MSYRLFALWAGIRPLALYQQLKQQQMTMQGWRQEKIIVVLRMCIPTAAAVGGGRIAWAVCLRARREPFIVPLVAATAPAERSPLQTA